MAKKVRKDPPAAPEHKRPVAKKSKPKVLPDEVAEKYKLKTVRPGKYNFHQFGTIDLREISIKKADELFEKDFPYLVLKVKDQAVEASDGPKE